WRLVLGDDPPARVLPLELHLKPNARLYRCKVKQYSPEKAEFLAKFNAERVKLGWVYENKKSRWACAALPVRKLNSNEYRQTNDYRPVNNMTEGIAGVMPSFQVRLERCKNKKFYASFDFLTGNRLLATATCQSLPSDTLLYDGPWNFHSDPSASQSMLEDDLLTQLEAIHHLGLNIRLSEVHP
ncbi:Glycoside hydrolase, partial [Phytophthora megakarya]